MKKKLVFILLILGIAAPFNFAETRITVDNSYLDWKEIPALAKFSSYFNPVYFNREIDGQAEILAMENSIYWRKGGTRIIEFKAYMEADRIYFYIETDSGFADELSILMYLYPVREINKSNIFTLELKPQRSGFGSVLLWEQGKTYPEIIGRLESSSIMLEGVVPLENFPETLIGSDINRLSFDLTTCYHESSSGLYEEFFFTIIRIKDLIWAEDL